MVLRLVAAGHAHVPARACASAWHPSSSSNFPSSSFWGHALCWGQDTENEYRFNAWSIQVQGTK